ncbi:hypothetical protein K438DRAFT_1936281 [Mycena galopus ATCC 62051]|nr:hypothetical protein K438DRAFT_1936281 [Mycena galopus ATCC 62051]
MSQESNTCLVEAHIKSDSVTSAVPQGSPVCKIIASRPQFLELPCSKPLCGVVLCRLRSSGCLSRDFKVKKQVSQACHSAVCTSSDPAVRTSSRSTPHSHPNYVKERTVRRMGRISATTATFEFWPSSGARNDCGVRHVIMLPDVILAVWRSWLVWRQISQMGFVFLMEGEVKETMWREKKKGCVDYETLGQASAALEPNRLHCLLEKCQKNALEFHKIAGEVFPDAVAVGVQEKEDAVGTL